MKRRSHQEWRELFEQQSQSNLSIKDFCRQHGIGQSYFYRRKSELCSIPAKSAFVKLKIPAVKHSSTMTIQYGSVTIILPSGMAAFNVAELVKALA